MWGEGGGRLGRVRSEGREFARGQSTGLVRLRSSGFILTKVGLASPPSFFTASCEISFISIYR